MAAQSANVFTEISTQFQSFFQTLTLPKKMVLFASLAVVLIGMIAMVYFSQQTTWTPLVSGLSPQDTALITQKLDELQVEYVIQPGGGGVLVPATQLDQARLDIAASNLQMGGTVGFEIFDQNNIGATEFQQNVQYRRALEGELSRLISKIKSIRSAKVLLALPEKSLFIDQEKQATASVSLELDRERKMNPREVKTIMNLVSGAVPGLNVDSVRISDQFGNLYAKGGENEELSEIRNSNFAYQHALEKYLERKALTQLEKIAGEGHVEVRVSSKINFDTSEVEENLVDPDGSAILSEEVATEQATGSRSIPVGVPGVTSNSPEVKAGASEVANVSDVNKKTKRTNYVNSKRYIKKKTSAGAIKQLSVAVLLDNKQERVTNEEGVTKIVPKAWSPDEKEQITAIAKRSVGFDEARGDTIELTNIQFQAPLGEDERLKFEKKKSEREFWLNTMKYTAVAVILLVVIMVVIRPMVQKLSAKPEDLDLLMGLPTTIGELEGEELEIPTEKEVGIPPRDKIVELAKQDPLRTASLIRTWLRDKK